MLLNRSFLALLQNRCSEEVCPDCGKNHEVLLQAKNDVVTAHFPLPNTCFGFKVQVNSLINTEVKRFLSDPFSLLPM